MQWHFYIPLCHCNICQEMNTYIIEIIWMPTLTVSYKMVYLCCLNKFTAAKAILASYADLDVCIQVPQEKKR